MSISPARTAAFDVLLKIEVEKAFSSTLLPVYEATLKPADRGLCHEIVMGVLRRQMLLDRYIDQFVNDRNLDVEVRVALRIGLFQIIFLERVPDHAAVNDTVALVARARKSSAKALVNAVLRKAATRIPDLTFTADVERVSIETSHPRWLIEKWTADFGADEAEALARANNTPPPLAFRPTVKWHATPVQLNYRRSELVDGCFFAEGLDDELRRLLDDGLVYFQDEASQMAAAAVKLTVGGSLLDVCSSPGGKVTAIAARTTDCGASFFAGDITWRRVELLRNTCRRQGTDLINIVQHDALTELPFPDREFDTVLVDAPCSGTGTIRHNPEIRYFSSPDDLPRLQKNQLAILRNASKTVKPGGSLFYTTCSLEREENEIVCEHFLSDAADFEKAKPQLPDRFIENSGFARTYPHRDQLDGFFIAEFRKED